MYVASAFKARVLCRYGAMAEVVTDRGSEFEGEFAALLEQALVDHRVTSREHPQADGLTERAVQTFKRALRRRCQDTKIGDQWDEDLPWIMLGYNCSVQAASGFSPYQLLHAQLPTVPPALKDRLDAPIDCSKTAAADHLLGRAKLLQQMCIEAGQGSCMRSIGSWNMTHTHTM